MTSLTLHARVALYAIQSRRHYLVYEELADTRSKSLLVIGTA
jgi:hypothetical protein